MGFTSSRNGAANAFSKLKNSTEPSGILHAVLVELAKLLAEPAIEQSQPTWSIAATRASMPALTFCCESPRARNIVCNPPFDLCDQFVRRALHLAGGKVAMIWLARRLNAARWLANTPLARAYLLTPRPSMPPGHVIAAGEKPGGGTQDFCWLIFSHKHKGPPTLHWLCRDGGHQ